MPKQTPKPTKTTRYRDAVTGEWVTEREAIQRPRETVKETTKGPPKKGGKGK